MPKKRKHLGTKRIGPKGLWGFVWGLQKTRVGSNMNKGVQILIVVLIFGVIALLTLLGWFLIWTYARKKQKPPLMVTGHSSCLEALQRWKAKAENLASDT